MASNFDMISDGPVDSVSEYFELITQMSSLLETGLTSGQLSVLIELLNCGVNCEELAKLIVGLRKEASQKQEQIVQLFGTNPHGAF